MSEDFRKLVTDLWSSLGLKAPTFRSTNQMVLNIDGMDVGLSESPDGRHMLVTGNAGRLSADPTRRIGQVQRILELNLAAMTSHRACVSAEPKGADTPAILIQGICSYESNVGDLTGIVQEVLSLVEAYAPDLRDERGPAGARARGPAKPQPVDEAVIFRP